MTLTPLVARISGSCWRQLILTAASTASETKAAVPASILLTCKGRANYLKLKEIRETGERPARFDLKRRFNYVKFEKSTVAA
jgi:hypothetical protein